MAGRNTMLEIGALIVPVKLEKISVRTDVKLDRASESGNKIKRVELDSVTGEECLDYKQGVFENPREGTGFREIPAEALEAIKEQTTLDTFQIEHFVPVKDLPTERFSDTYYLAPQTGVNPKPLKLLHEALKRTKKAGVFKLTLTSRQYLAALYAHNGALIVNLMHFAGDFKKAERAGEKLVGVEVDPKQVALASDLIEAMSADADVIDSFEDDLVPLKQSLVDAALAGKTLRREKGKKAPEPQDDLAEQLRASYEQIKGKKAPAERTVKEHKKDGRTVKEHTKREPKVTA
jgi:DNA end-binding protein Ku